MFLAPGPDVQAVILYLACLKARLPLCLAEPQPDPLARLSGVYRPDLVLTPDTLADARGMDGRRVSRCPGYAAASPSAVSDQSLHPDLALMLTTSGSTGSPKLVRLTARNLESNASAIAEYLELGPGERAIQSLPMHYSYGLSVLNSHLLAGATVVLTPHSFMRPEFWRDVEGGGRHLVRRRPLHVRDASPASVRPRAGTRRSGHSPRPVAPCART